MGLVSTESGRHKCVEDLAEVLDVVGVNLQFVQGGADVRKDVVHTAFSRDLERKKFKARSVSFFGSQVGT